MAMPLHFPRALCAAGLLTVPILAGAACAPAAPRSADLPVVERAPAAPIDRVGRADPATLRTDEPSYGAYGVIRLSLRAPSDRAIRYDLCRRRLERREGGVWRPVRTWAERECDARLFELSPGSGVSVGVRIPGEVQLGQYRFSLPVHDPATGAPSVLATDPFLLERSRWESALRMELEASPRTVSAGDTVRLRAVTHNTSADTLQVGTACGPAMDVQVISPEGVTTSVLHRMMRPRGRPDAEVAFSCELRPDHFVLPRDSLVSELRWRAPPGRGEYLAVAHARRSQGVQLRSDPVRIRVR